MELKPLHTRKDYEVALREVSPFFDREPNPDTPDGELFEAMLKQIEAYEQKHHPMALARTKD